MLRRVPDNRRLKHRVTVNLTDDEYAMLQAEATDRGLAPSTVARHIFAEALPDVRKRRLAVKRQTDYRGRKTRETNA